MGDARIINDYIGGLVGLREGVCEWCMENA